MKNLFFLLFILFNCTSCCSQPQFKFIAGDISNRNPNSSDIIIGAFFITKHPISHKMFLDFLNSSFMDSIPNKEGLFQKEENNIVFFEDIFKISDSKYDNEPILSVTEKGKSLFCKWLESERDKWVSKTNKKPDELGFFRPPTHDELILYKYKVKKENFFWICISFLGRTSNVEF
ncbi:MAG: hypothetical protein JJT94_14725 [Bernardetiaceae bacterium]|nr:hypothetical protein [Bernardetiaceae bacterium]